MLDDTRKIILINNISRYINKYELNLELVRNFELKHKTVFHGRIQNLSMYLYVLAIVIKHSTRVIITHFSSERIACQKRFKRKKNKRTLFPGYLFSL